MFALILRIRQGQVQYSQMQVSESPPSFLIKRNFVKLVGLWRATPLRPVANRISSLLYCLQIPGQAFQLLYSVIYECYYMLGMLLVIYPSP